MFSKKSLTSLRVKCWFKKNSVIYMCVLTTLLLADTTFYPASKVSDWLHEITVVCTVLPLVATYSFVASMQSKGTVQIYSF